MRATFVCDRSRHPGTACLTSDEKEGGLAPPPALAQSFMALSRQKSLAERCEASYGAPEAGSRAKLGKHLNVF